MLMAFSDFPSDDAKYWTHEEYLTYLQDYCKKYELDKHIVGQSAAKRAATASPDPRARARGARH